MRVLLAFPLGKGGPAGPDEGRVYRGTPIADGNGKAAPPIRQRSRPLTAPLGESHTHTKYK